MIEINHFQSESSTCHLQCGQVFVWKWQMLNESILYLKCIQLLKSLVSTGLLTKHTKQKTKLSESQSQFFFFSKWLERFGVVQWLNLTSSYTLALLLVCEDTVTSYLYHVSLEYLTPVSTKCLLFSYLGNNLGHFLFLPCWSCSFESRNEPLHTCLLLMFWKGVVVWEWTSWGTFVSGELSGVLLVCIHLVWFCSVRCSWYLERTAVVICGGGLINRNTRGLPCAQSSRQRLSETARLGRCTRWHHVCLE